MPEVSEKRLALDGISVLRKALTLTYSGLGEAQIRQSPLALVQSIDSKTDNQTIPPPGAGGQIPWTNSLLNLVRSDILCLTGLTGGWGKEEEGFAEFCENVGHSV